MNEPDEIIIGLQQVAEASVTHADGTTDEETKEETP